MAKRGRPRGATSWWRNSNRVAAHHAQVLMELWLAGLPVLGVRGNTVPPKIKRKLCRLAVHAVVARWEPRAAGPDRGMLEPAGERASLAADNGGAGT
jgi:hypothetical protein